MLSYQHEHHFGNHADVLKHAVLALVIRALQGKDKPFHVLDAHAGSGVYSVRGAPSRSRPEYPDGIGRVLAAPDPPQALAPYLEVVRGLNPGLASGGRLERYPGSPAIAAALLRESDHLTLLERHPGALANLRRHFGKDRRVHIHERDSFEGLRALLPPAERRGLVLFDSAYERKEDFRGAVEALAEVHARWNGGVWLIWYPLIVDPEARRFPARIAATGVRPVYQVTLQVERDDHPGLRGSGLLIVNLPWGLEEPLAALLPWLWRTLSPDRHGRWDAGWLVPEQ
jgi:23S rRNA (adenine2030-N6)-methyltransferase